MENNGQKISLLSQKMSSFLLKEAPNNEALKIFLLCLFTHEEKGYHALNFEDIDEYEAYFQKEELIEFLNLRNNLGEMISIFKNNYPKLFLGAGSPLYCNENYLMTRRSKLLHETFKKELERRFSTETVPIAFNEEDIPKDLSPSQKEAFLKILQTSTLFVTGGPGSGKTTLLTQIIKVFIEKLEMRVTVASPTAKAKNRLLEELKMDDGKLFQSNTLHGLLKRSSNPFKTRSHFILDCNLLIIDEASMMNLDLFTELLKHTPSPTRLMIVGDEHQLAPVLSDNIFKSIVFGLREKLDLFHPFIAELKGQYRQSSLLYPISNSLRDENTKEFLLKLDAIQGLKPLSHLEKSIEDVIERYRLSSLKESLNFKKRQVDEDLILESLKKLNHFIFLSPIHAKSYGIKHINSLFKIKISPLKFYPGLPIIINRNDKNLGLSNGDRGLCFQMEMKFYFAFYTSKLLIYPAELIIDYDVAYCISIHKSQGSEYPEVHVVLTEDSDIGKDALYTAITRSKESFTIYAKIETLKTTLEKHGGGNSFISKKMKEINF